MRVLLRRAATGFEGRDESRLRRGWREGRGTQRGAEGQRGVQRIDWDNSRAFQGDATEEVTWDSIVVPRLPKYYSTAVESYVSETLMASIGHPKAYSRGPAPGDSPRGIIPIRSYRNAERTVSYQSDRSADRIISPYIEESVHLSLGRSPRSPSFPTASKTGVPDTPSILAF